MQIYLLGKVRNIKQGDWMLRQAAAKLAFLDGNIILGFEEEQLSFEDEDFELLKEISYLLEADAVWLLNDFNNCEDAKLLLAMAIRLRLSILPAADCIVPKRVCFEIDF